MAIFFRDQRLAHMSKGDAYIWSKFIDQHPNYFSNIRYDVRVGKSVTLPKEYPDWLKKSAEALSKKRIDIVADTKKTTCIIEVRVNAKANVIGTLLSYKKLFEISYNPKKPVSITLITNSLETDLLLILKSLKIPFFVV